MSSFYYTEKPGYFAVPEKIQKKMKRLGTGTAVLLADASAAYAVPAELNIETSGGKPTRTGAGENAIPFKNPRREIRRRLVMTCDIDWPPCERFFSSLNQRDEQFLEPKPGSAKIFQCLVQRRPVCRRLHPAGHVAKHLLHNALLALRGPCQHLTQLTRVCELRIFESCHHPAGVEFQFYYLRFCLARRNHIF